MHNEAGQGLLHTSLWHQACHPTLSCSDENPAEADDPATSPAQPTGSQQTTHLPRVLIIDDERLIANTVVRILNLNGFQAVAAYSGDEALAQVDAFCPDIVLTDVRMPGRNGIEVATLIRARRPTTQIVLFSGQAGVSNLIDAARDGHGFPLWPKPIAPNELVRRLRALTHGA